MWTEELDGAVNAVSEGCEKRDSACAVVGECLRVRIRMSLYTPERIIVARGVGGARVQSASPLRHWT